MTERNRLFDDDRLSRLQARARVRQTRNTPFLIERAVEDLAERLLDVNRNFARVCLIGPFDWRAQIEAALPPAKRFESFDHVAVPQGQDYDLVISLLYLQSLDDVPGVMRAARGLLRPDGLFIGAMLGGQSLGELRTALYAVDTQALGAPTPRVHPMIDVRASATLLGHAGLAIPVSDSDRFTVRYRALTTLANDLRDLGLSNALVARDGRMVPSLLRALEAQMRDGDGLIPVSWEIVWMTGWAPHDSQQKPLKPGSAKMGLNTALRTIQERSVRDGSSEDPSL